MGQREWRESNAASLASTPEPVNARGRRADDRACRIDVRRPGMTALWTSFLVVVLAEMGDKTQLVALALAARYRRP